jgi:hypothetical protein
MTDEEKRNLMAQMMRIVQGGMVGMMEALTEDGATVEINGVKVTPEDAKRARAAFGPADTDGSDN